MPFSNKLPDADNSSKMQYNSTILISGYDTFLSATGNFQQSRECQKWLNLKKLNKVPFQTIKKNSNYYWSGIRSKKKNSKNFWDVITKFIII